MREIINGNTFRKGLSVRCYLFKWLYYISALLFGFIHIFNYQFNDTHYLFIPFITTGQLFGGLMLGYIRIIYGFWYDVLLHALFNSLMIGGYFIFDYHF
ncbi:type II CAAX prenyl endopeptidase Rce1 family protein [Dyadobacter sp. 3J3]|uniref:CPBP family glutamic-type intramembrane protease n=1 Tax=Dyadobacter sp. 3J3 TaxID=2606600 RepID=UPI0038D370B9